MIGLVVAIRLNLVLGFVIWFLALVLMGWSFCNGGGKFGMIGGGGDSPEVVVCDEDVSLCEEERV